MTRTLQILTVFMVHIYFCIMYLVFGIDSQNFLGRVVKFQFEEEHVYFILLLSSLTIVVMLCAFFTPIKIRFKHYEYKRKRIQAEIFIIGIPLFLFIAYKVFSSGLNYGVLATGREQYSFLIELRVIPYLHFIQYYSQNYRKHSYYFKSFVFLVLLLTLLYQARSIYLEVLLIMFCLKLREDRDKLRWSYLALGVLILPLSNIVVGIRDKRTIYEISNELFNFEYLIIFNNIMAASLNFDYADKSLWIYERLVLIVPSPLRSMFGLINPSNDLFGEISSKAKLFSGGFSYIANGYIIFGFYFLLIFYFLYLLAEIIRVNFMNHKINNYIVATYPILLSYIILAIRNDLGVLSKQVIQLIIIALLMNFISRLVIRR